jgi:tetratricopeptide (TPR) repeat protein
LLLDYFTEKDVARYLANRFPDRDFPDRLSQLIHQKTGGNPLFVTALVDDLVANQSIEEHRGRWRLSGDPEQIDDWRLVSLRQTIEVQLTRLLPDEQRILEAAAVAGKEFTLDLVAAALETDTADIEDHCDQLVRRRQILRLAQDGPASNFTGSTRYAFSHDLYRTAALDRSLRGRRRHWYQRIAEKMVSTYGDRADEVATELAYYFQQANRPHEAAHYLAIAGERASRRFAHVETISQFQRGIELLQQTAPSEERDALELRSQVGLADLLVAVQGHRSHEVLAVLSRARELNEKLGDGPQSFAALRGLYELLIGRPDYEGTLELCDKMDRVARRENDSYIAAEALRLRGLSTFFLGRLRESQKALAESIAVYNRGAPTSKVFGIREEPLATPASVLALAAASVLALVLWMLGYPDQALLWSRDAVGRANAVGAPFTIAVARCFRAMLMQFLRDSTATIHEADSAIDICDRYGFSYWRAQASLERGWAIVIQGRAAEGLKEMRSVLASVSLGVGGSMAKLAEACLQAGKTNEGLTTIDEALQFVLEHKEGTWEPELHRLKGELLIQRVQARAPKRSTDVEQAERCFSTAIQRARENDAKSFELRAAMSLGRLWRKHGKRNEARRVVSDVYDWFTEGFSTPDLTDAKRLLGTR